MRLYLKQKVFSWGDKFTIYDEFGNDRYYVEGEVFTFGKKLHLYDIHGHECCFIRQKVWSFLPQFFINRNGSEIARVVKELTLFRQEYTVEGFGWKVEGDFFAHDYTISSPAGTVARISKRWLSWGDAYEVDVTPGIDEINALAVVLIIDACLEITNTNASSCN